MLESKFLLYDHFRNIDAYHQHQWLIIKPTAVIQALVT